MRTETDTFKQLDDEGCYCNAEIEHGNVLITCFDACGATYTLLTKDQAQEFVRQLLEISGEEE